MQLRQVLLLLTVLFLAPNLTAQSNEKLVSINFEGLAKTKIFFVQEIIQSHKGREISVEQIEDDVQNLKNLSSIGHVTYGLSLALLILIGKVKVNHLAYIIKTMTKDILGKFIIESQTLRIKHGVIPLVLQNGLR